jgi:hypothetical protein
MYSASRKVQRNTFAHYRAQQLFAPIQATDRRPGHPDILTSPPERLRQRVRDGLLGFVPSAVPALL